MLFNLFAKPKVQVKKGNLKPTVLVVLDGWGVAPPSPGNAVTLANPPNFNKYMTQFPHGQLLAAGESVGLPADEVGNTEVGHLSMGSGRLILQDLKKIDKSIEEGSFFENKAFYHASFHAQKNNSKVHIMGMISSGHVHSSINHMYALLEFVKRANTDPKNVYLHLFTDGRDAPPDEALSLIQKLEEYLKINNAGNIATIGGRYYGMDRDKRWDRTGKAYDAMTKGIGPVAQSASEAIKASYAQKITDEFIVPTVINKNGMIGKGDAVIFFNYRIDRPRQLTMAFVLKDFTSSSISFGFDPYSVKYGQVHAKEGTQEKIPEPFPRGNAIENLFFVTMTQYQSNLPVSEIAFPPEQVIDSLSVVLAKHGLNQMHLAESEKERFITYYFDGLREERQTGEDVIIIPSPHVATYDKKPEMSVHTLAEEFKKTLNQDKYNFILMNIANADMVAHTGNLKAAMKAIGEVDIALKEIVEGVLTCDGTVLITADHGNAEEMITYPTTSYFFTSSEGKLNTNHSKNPVPLIIINKSFKAGQLPNGTQADVAPTILKIMGIEIPPVMTGKNLIV